MKTPESDDKPAAEPQPPPLPEVEYRSECPNHLGVMVRYRCVECGFGGCSDCTSRRDNQITGALSYWCLHCGNRTIEVAPAPLKGPRFYEELPRCLIFPLRPFNFPHFLLYALLAFGTDLLVTPLFTLIPTLMLPVSSGDVTIVLKFAAVIFFGPWVWVLGLHYLLAFIEDAASGSTTAQAITNVDIRDVAARKRMGAAGVLFCAASLPLLLLLAGRGDPMLRPLALLYGLVQCLIPMGLAMIAVAHQPGASRSIPHLLKSIGRVKNDYLILLACSLPLFLPDILIAFFRPNLLTFYWIFASPARAYVRVVQVNMMGRIARERADELTWAA